MMKGQRLSTTSSSIQKAILSNASSKRGVVLNCNDRLLTTYSNNTNSKPVTYKQHVYNKHSFHLQHFSSTSGGGDNDDKKEDDPFGLTYDDNTPNNIGNTIPPSYTRDETTGKFTGELQSELSPQDLKLLNLNAVDAERQLVDKFVQSWNDDDDDEEEKEEKMMELAERVREEQIAFGRIGRAPSTPHTDDKDGEDDKYTSGLTPSEASTLKEFLKRRYNRDLTSSPDDNTTYNLQDDIPIQSIQSGATSKTSNNNNNNTDQDLTYLTPPAQKILSEHTTNLPPDDPFLDLMPHDLNPTRKVNRRRAQPIPPSLLHHNNLSLLRRYVTPGGQIMNRVQSRLGAKDQRKVAKMVKRARHLGLIPHMGQWKLEDHGNLSELEVLEKERKKRMMMDGGGLEEEEDDLMVEKDWEKELKRRGLVIEYKPAMSPDMVDKMLELEQRIFGDGVVGVGDDDLVEDGETLEKKD
eukprot:CAMPEP_0185734292 /NCGR_PEP_ID=MMETSP1171-20130828/22044_1 /TAXON_ID=374046 /ORGANISM="Helicotheca tamensis, Strain CCMP826" /LENGTH=465 /DNA_ID=CAMNT_0028404251 /DNA_START=15 /DNA_END=1412 /DNA_ORIENTATION=-